ncbi:hypothetical protein [Clostridium argentinense]|nr:hypothetical protein [Clostridium argentinense]ARC85139.1 hypothetical protein RSJ17_11850 [Clostridium argentinense]
MNKVKKIILSSSLLISTVILTSLVKMESNMDFNIYDRFMNSAISSTIEEQSTLENSIPVKDNSVEDQIPKGTKKIEPSGNTYNEEERIAFSRGGNMDDIDESPILPKGATISTEKMIQKPFKPKIENLDWWGEAQYLYPIGSVAEIEDIYTGKTFKMKRTFGTNHADVEALTSNDTEVIKSIWGGFSWERRPIIVKINGRRIAASMAGMPHAGNDAYPALSQAPDLSDGYGTGQNLDVVKGNNMDGVCDIHFLNSTRHEDGSVEAVSDPEHQENIEIASKSK